MFPPDFEVCTFDFDAGELTLTIENQGPIKELCLLKLEGALLPVRAMICFMKRIQENLSRAQDSQMNKEEDDTVGSVVGGLA